MSIWGDIRKKSLGQEVRLEDFGTIKKSEEESPKPIYVDKNRACINKKQIAVLQEELKRMTYISKNLKKDCKNLRRDMENLFGSYRIDRI